MKQYYYTCQRAPLETLMAERKNTIIPEIQQLETLLEKRKLQLQSLNVFIGVHHPETTAIQTLQKCILLSNL